MTPFEIVLITVVALACVLPPIVFVKVLPKFFRPDEEVPGFGARMENCPYYEGYITDALNAFELGWLRRWPNDESKLENCLDNLNIYWLDVEYFLAVDNKTKAAGECVARDRIKVATKDRTLGQTAFFHELVHAVLMWTERIADYDHLGDEVVAWNQGHEDLIKELKVRFAHVKHQR